jgi:hypothetical protein
LSYGLPNQRDGSRRLGTLVFREKGHDRIYDGRAARVSCHLVVIHGLRYLSWKPIVMPDGGASTWRGSTDKVLSPEKNTDDAPALGCAVAGHVELVEATLACRGLVVTVWS